MKKNAMQKGEEQGVALIFAIGIVSLMMMLAITYATVSMTERDVAKNSTYRASAALLADSCVKNVLYILNQYSADNDPSHAWTVRSGRLPSLMCLRSVGTNQEDLQKLLAVRNNLIYSYQNDAMYNSLLNMYDSSVLSSSSAPGWQSVREDPSDSSSKIVARFAYTTWKPHGILDPFLSSGRSTMDGLRIQDDINFSSLSLNSSSFPSLTSGSCTYRSWDVLFRKMSPDRSITPTSVANDEANNNYINNWFTYPRSPYSDETFWYKKPSDSNPKRYYRFNLNQDDWTKFTVEDVAGKTNITNLTNLSEYKLSDKGLTSGTTSPTQCIPWFETTTSSLTAEQKRQRQQAAANFIAFMAEINGKTAENLDSSLRDSSRDYFANFRAPYLNEIGVKYDFSLSQVDQEERIDSVNNTKKTYYKYKLSTTMTVYVELLNYYNLDDADYVLNGKILNGSEITLSGSSENDILSGQKIEIPAFEGSEFGSVRVGNKGFYTLMVSKTLSTNESDWTPIDPDKVVVSSSSTQIVPEIVSVMQSGYSVDCTKFDSTCSYMINFGSMNVGGSGGYVYYRSWQAKDAANNLSGSNWFRSITDADIVGTTSNWSIKTDSYLESGPENILKLQSNNQEITISPADKIDENKSFLSCDPGNIMNTLKSKNNFTPSDLGYVHRGADRQTLNISMYNKNNTSNYISEDSSSKLQYLTGGMGDYSHGDAYLWEQLYWNDEYKQVYEFGKINLNMIYDNSTHTSKLDTRSNLEAAKVLFKEGAKEYGINTANVAYRIAKGNYSELDSNILTKQFHFRFQALEQLEDLLLALPTKVKKDEKIGKFILHTTAGPAPYEADDTVFVIGVAQIVRDLGGKIPKRNADGTISLKSATVGTWDSGVDEILSTRRVLAVLQKNDQGKWIILRLEYVD